MAIQIIKETSHGFTCNEAYVRIMRVVFPIGKMKIRFAIYASKEARDLDLDPIDRGLMSIDANAESPIDLTDFSTPLEYAYSVLKTDPRFVNGEDI